jgi:dTDP-4-dehydrorhamnose reductase
MSWLITGGSGQLGIALSKELSNRGILFTAWSKKDLDITQDMHVEEVVSKLLPKVIVNCAAWTDVDGAESKELLASKVNSNGAKNMASAAKLFNAKLIQISTDYVFSGEGNAPRGVQELTNPQSAYGRTKAEGEALVFSAYPENSLVVRTAWLYSPWGKNFAKTMTRLASRTEDKIGVVNDQMGQPTSAADLANLLVELIQSDSPAGTYHGTNAGQATWYEFAREIFKIVGADVDRVLPVSSDEFLSPAKRPKYSVLSHDSWAKTTMKPMRDWQIALGEAMPAIISVIKAGE